MRRLLLACAVVCTSVVALTAVPTPAPAQSLYLTETFTGATAEAGFVAYGAACLTGAPAGATPPGAHELGGCPENRVGPVPPLDAAPHGYLQLTDASNDKAAAVLYDVPIPAEQGLRVTFEQWQYGSTTRVPADGIGFFLVDGAGTLSAPGAYGGSLGYAQKLPDDDPAEELIPGVDGEYLGIGLDVRGNCCFITSTPENLGSTVGPWPSTRPVSLHADVSSVPSDPAESEAALAPAARTITVQITPAPDPVVTVSIAVPGGEPIQVLQFAAPEPVPASYKFGFSASTGEFTDVHLIRNLVIESVAPAPVLEIEKTPEGPGPFEVGDEVEYTYQVRNTGDAGVTGLRVIDDRVGDIICDSTELTPGTDPVGSVTACRGTHVITEADAEAGRVSITATASGNGGNVVSPPDSAIITVDPPPPTTTTTTTRPTRTKAGSPTGCPDGDISSLPWPPLPPWVECAQELPWPWGPRIFW